MLLAMTSLDPSSPDDGRTREAGPRSRMHLRVERPTPSYCRVNRVVSDAERERETERVARRLAGFDKRALAETKAFVDAISLPEDAEPPPALSAFFASSARPGTQARLAALASHGMATDTELERRLGELVTLSRAVR